MKHYEAALVSNEHALNITLKLPVEDHPDAAECYDEIGDTQAGMKDYTLALESYQNALQIKLKWYGEHHLDTAKSYQNIENVQQRMKSNVNNTPKGKKWSYWLKYSWGPLYQIIKRWLS
jgi:tetratricopeptide (TPR) repeat protein